MFPSIEPASLLVSRDQVMEILWSLQTEIAIFIVAFLTHALIFGKHRVPFRKSMPTNKPKLAQRPLPDQSNLGGRRPSPAANLVKAHLLNGSLKEAREVIDSMRQEGFQPNCVAFNELVEAAVKVSIECAWGIIEEMATCRVKPNRITCSILLKSIQQSSSGANVNRILELLDDMDDEMDDVLLSSTVEAIIRCGRSELLAAHLGKWWSSGKMHVKSAHTIGSLIRAHGHIGDLDGVWRTWTDMRKRRIMPTSITLGCMVEALVTNGDADAAYEVLQEMLQDSTCKSLVNSVVFGSVLKGFSHQKRFDRVWSTYEEMLEHDLKFSIVTFNTIMDACARCGQVTRISSLLDSMTGQGIAPNIITYGIVIKGYCQENKLEEALQVWESMVQTTDFRPDEVMFNTILDGCARKGLYARGMALLEEMRRSGIRPSNFTLSVLVKMASRAKLLDKAFEICEEISQAYKFKLNVHVYNNLVQACATNDVLPRAFEVLEQMIRERVRPDVRTYSLLIKACVSASKVKECSGLVRAALGLENAHPILAKCANFARLQKGLPSDLLVEVLEALSAQGDASVVAIELWKDVKFVPGLRLPSRLHLRLASQACRN